MFDFERWGEWLERRASELQTDRITATFSDNRDLPETQLNPSYGLDVSAGKAMGWIRFWRIGTCDYEFWDGCNERSHIMEMGHDATDATVVPLTEHFISLFLPAETLIR